MPKLMTVACSVLSLLEFEDEAMEKKEIELVFVVVESLRLQ